MSDPDAPTVRDAAPADFPRLRAIQATALDESWPELLEAALDGPPLVLVLESTQPVGYALVVPADGVAYLSELAVEPAEQGRGYGTQLLRALIDRLCARDVETVRLTARADDERVRSFYEEFDFEVVDEVTDHYEDGDAVVMARDL